MDNASQKRAVRNYRARLSQRGLARFEVLGRPADRALIRALAKHLAEDGPRAAALRKVADESMNAVNKELKPSTKGEIYAALRRSPLVGANLDLTRPRIVERDVDL